MGMFWWWPFGKVPEVSPQQLDALRKDGAAPPQIIDVRTTMEWRSGHIAGAVHVPISDLGSRVASLSWTGRVPSSPSAARRIAACPPCACCASTAFATPASCRAA